MKKSAAFVCAIIIATVLAAASTHSASAQPVAPTPTTPNVLVSAPTTFGGAFSKLNVVGNRAFMTEGSQRIVVYDATDRLQAGEEIYRQNPPRLAESPVLETILDMAVEQAADGSFVIFTLTGNWRVDNITLSAWSFNGGPNITKIREIKLSGWYMRLGDQHLWITGRSGLAKVDRNTFAVLGSFTNPAPAQSTAGYVVEQGELRVKLTQSEVEAYVGKAAEVTAKVTSNASTTDAAIMAMPALPTDEVVNKALAYTINATAAASNEIYMRPAVWGNRVFIPFWSTLYVLDQNTLKIVDRWEFDSPIQQVELDTSGQYLMVAVPSQQYAAIEGTDYQVYSMSSRQRVMTQWDGIGIRWFNEPSTSGLVQDGHLVVAGGWAGLQVWDIKTGRQLLDEQGGRYPYEAQKVGKGVYVIDWNSGLLRTEWYDEFGDSVGDYFATVMIVPSLSDVSVARPVGRFVAALGTTGLYIYDPTARRITGYNEFLGGGDDNRHGDNLELFIQGNLDGSYQVTVGGGGESSVENVTVTRDGTLIRGESYFHWFGDTFVPLGQDDLIATVTTDFGQPTLVTITSANTGVIIDSAIVGQTREAGLDIAFDTSLSMLYVLTEVFGKEEYAIHRLSVSYGPMGASLEHQGKLPVGRTFVLSAGNGTLWTVSESGLILYYDLDGLHYQASDWHDYINTVATADGSFGLAGEYLGYRVNSYEARGNFGRTLVRFLEFDMSGPVNRISFSQETGTAYVALSNAGFAVMRYGAVASSVYMPITGR